MPIEITCDNCQARLRVPDRAAGKRIKCPKCSGVTSVPADAADDRLTWQVQSEEGEVYGPVSKAELDQWVTEGRVTEESQLLRDGSDQWQWAADVYPELAGGDAPAPFPTVSKPSGGGSGGGSGAFDFGGPAKGGGAAKDSGGSGAFDFAAGASQPASDGGSSGPFDFAGDSSPSARVGGRGKSRGKRGRSTRSGGGQGSDRKSPKSKVVAGVLQLTLGGLGIGRFYLGYTGIGIAQLLTGGGCGIWSLIDGIMILTGSVARDAQGRRLE